ncbi:RNA polymerase sigma factor [Gorillibacterium massiliense]|uniref:RNA polymerase sigma factor n=1 Tax=Gorillibacterium massiliense TaxID=1280390 RepID=UPI0004BAE90B|nr:sigma-70 family RNA polymerase sigma factor [Gorillibacterium massiliense]
MEKEEYLKHASNLDVPQFRELMETYGQEVWNFAFLMTKKRDLADDVTQEVFLKVLQKIGAFRGESSFKTWLFSIARNTSVSMLRSSFFRRVTLVEFIAPSSGHPSAEEEAMENMFADEIWTQVLKLPGKYREVLLLDGKYELSVKEIAQILGEPEGTVKSKLSRARAKMNELAREEELRYERAKDSVV